MKIKVNDNVKILSGKSRGKTGKVIQAFPNDEKVVVEGANLMKKHMRPQKQGDKGQTIELAAPLHVSNVKLICPKCSLETRVGHKQEGDKNKRKCKKCNEVID